MARAAAPQVRTGRVSKINYEAGTYEVTYADRGGAVTCPINAVSNGRYKMPEIGDIVCVEHNGNGTVMGTTVGTVWNRSNMPVNGRQGLYRQEFGRTKGKAYEEYDDNTGVLQTNADTGIRRNSKGEIFDESAGPTTVTAGGQLMLQSSGSSASIAAASGVGIAAGEAVDIEAGSYLSMTSAAEMTVECGGDATVKVTGETTEEYTGKVSRTHTAEVSETNEADVTRTTEGNEDATVEGDASLTVNGTLKITVGGTTITIDPGGNVEVDAGAEVTITAGGSVNISAAGALNINGPTGDVTVNGVSLVHHTHQNAGAGQPNR